MRREIKADLKKDAEKRLKSQKRALKKGFKGDRETQKSIKIIVKQSIKNLEQEIKELS